MRWPAALLVLGATAGVVGCGGGEGDEAGTGNLSWAGQPKVTISPEVPGVRIVSGRVRNDSLRRLRLSARDLRLRTADGRAVDADFGFVGAYVRPDQPRNRSEEELPESELERVGAAARLDPGATAALTGSWRAPKKAAGSLRIVHRGGSLPVPEGE